MIAEIEKRRPPSLGVRSQKFLDQLRAYASEFDPVRLSAKQWNRLNGLAEDAGASRSTASKNDKLSAYVVNTARRHG